MQVLNRANVQDRSKIQLVNDLRVEHGRIAEEIVDVFKKHSDFNVTVANEVDVTQEHMEGQDLCIALGGDHTFMKAAKSLRNGKDTAILGINS